MSSSQSESPENYLGRKVVACPTVLVLSCAVCPSLPSSVCSFSYWSYQFRLQNYIKVVIFTIGNKLIVISIVVPAALFIVSTSSNSSLPISSSALSLYSRCHFFSNRTFVNRKQTLPWASRPSSFLDLFVPGLALFSSLVSHLLTCIPSHSYCLYITEKLTFPIWSQATTCGDRKLWKGGVVREEKKNKQYNNLNNKQTKYSFDETRLGALLCGGV